MSKPRMILFDYGQTLVDEVWFDREAGYDAVLRASHNPRGATAAQATALWQELMRDVDYDVHSLEVLEHCYRRYVFEMLDVELRLPPQELERIYLDASLRTQPTEGSREMLAELRRRGIRIGVVSNVAISAQGLRYIIGQHHPLGWFEFILASSEYVFRKPHRRFFEMALHKAGLDAGEIWFCGDNPVCDVEGSRAVGMTPVWYLGALHGRVLPRPACEHREITGWDELLRALDAEE